MDSDLQKQVDHYALTRVIFAVKTLNILECTLETEAQNPTLNPTAIAALGAAIASVLNAVPVPSPVQ